MNGTNSEAACCAFRVYASGSLSSEIEAHSSPRKLDDAVVLEAETVERTDLGAVALLLDGIVVERAWVGGVEVRCAGVSLTRSRVVACTVGIPSAPAPGFL